MWVIAARSAVLSVITGGGKWLELKLHSPIRSTSISRRKEILALRADGATAAVRD
jgi:hypothetical protein